MTKVIDPNARLSREAEARAQPVMVRVLHVDGRRMTTRFLRQIPTVWTENLPRTQLGWVCDQGRPWLLWRDEKGRLARSDIIDWVRIEAGGTRTPVTEHVNFSLGARPC